MSSVPNTTPNTTQTDLDDVGADCRYIACSVGGGAATPIICLIDPRTTIATLRISSDKDHIIL